MRNFFVFDGFDSRSCGVYVSGTGVYDAPERSYDVYEIPGRDGEYIGTNSRLSNVEVTYPAFIYTNFKKNLSALKTELLSRDGYVRLYDSYYSDRYRIARYSGGLEVEPTPRGDAGSFELRFSCKPFYFLNAGEEKKTYSSDGYIVNPTQYASEPLLRIYGNGTARIGRTDIIINTVYEYTDINSEIMDCYYGERAVNAFVSFSGNDFPLLDPGDNVIMLGTGITKIEVIPNWRCL